MRAKASAANERLRQQQAKHFQQDADIFPASRPNTRQQLAKQSHCRTESHLSAVFRHLVLIDLKHDGLQDEGGGGDHVERLLGLGQPVDEVLQ